MPSDADYIARAIQLAARGHYTTDPNPRVGCVIVKDGSVIGEGWHERAGGPHAEPVALAAAGSAAAGATVYISLEPCSTIGRTGACSTMEPAYITATRSAMTGNKLRSWVMNSNATRRSRCNRRSRRLCTASKDRGQRLCPLRRIDRHGCLVDGARPF